MSHRNIRLIDTGDLMRECHAVGHGRLLVARDVARKEVVVECVTDRDGRAFRKVLCPCHIVECERRDRAPVHRVVLRDSQDGDIGISHERDEISHTPPPCERWYTEQKTRETNEPGERY